MQSAHHSNTTLLIRQELLLFAAAYFHINTQSAKSPTHPTWIMSKLMGAHFSYFHSFILHSVNPYKVLNNLKDIELVILLIIYI